MTKEKLQSAAVVIAYALLATLAVGAQGVLTQHAFDEKWIEVLLLIGTGALIAGFLTLRFLSHFIFSSKPFYFFCLFSVVSLLTLLAQSALHGVLFYATNYIEREPFLSLHWFMQLISTTLSGVAYFVIFGVRLFWPAGCFAAVLFALASLGLKRREF